MGRAPDTRINDIRALLVRSGNLCAFPGCSQRLVNHRNDFVAQVCHISAASPEGPRYDSRLSDDARRAATNLIILCYPHHIEVDGHPAEFPTQALLDMKRAHEERVERFAPPPEAVLQAVLQPSIVHDLPPRWLSAIAARSAFRCLPMVAGGPNPLRSFGPRTSLATHLVGAGIMACAMTIDPKGPARQASGLARLLSYGAAGKLIPNAPPPGAVDAATSMARACSTAALAVSDHYGTSIDARAAMLCSVSAMPDSREALEKDLAIATAPGELDLERFLLRPLWEPAEDGPWRETLDAFTSAIETSGGGDLELRRTLGDAMRKLTLGRLSRRDLELCFDRWLNDQSIQHRLRSEASLSGV
jgi:hypothetical protein